MPIRLRALPFAALACAAVDTVAVRMKLVHREAEPRLFAQAFLLWLVFGLIALAPAFVGSKLWRRFRARRADAQKDDALGMSLALVAWMALPVIAHARLDRYSDLGGGLSQLASPWPWLDVLGWCAGAAAILWLAHRFLARVPLWITGSAVAILAIATGLLVHFHEGADRPEARAASDTRPNLLLLIWDTTRAPSLNVYGYDRDTTPNLARFASESIVFENARSASRYTLTSHLSILTGVYPSDHGARMTRQRISPSRTPSIAAELRRAGYRTGGFVGTGVLQAGTGVGFGFETWDDLVDPAVCDTQAWGLVHDLQSILASFGPPFSRNGQPHWIQDFTRPASEVLAHAARWIDDGDPRPWFCMINLYDAHWPYLPELPASEQWVEPYRGPVDGYLTRSDHFDKHRALDEADNRHLRELYDAELWQLDREVDGFLAKLDLAKANTAVVMTSDHGEAFGEGGRYEHNDILETQVHVPLCVRLPRAAASVARKETRPVSGVDIAPTLLELAGVQHSANAHYLGTSLLSPAPASDAGERTILVEDRDQMSRSDVRIALYRGTWKLERTGLDDKQRFLLYDLATDPIGLRDVSSDHADIVAELREELDRFRGQWHADDQRDAEGEQGFMNSAALRGLGYTGK